VKIVLTLRSYALRNIVHTNVYNAAHPHSLACHLDGNIFSVSQFLTYLWSLVSWVPPPALLPFPKKTAANSFLADVCLNCFGLFGECVCIHCFDCSLVSTFTNETQVSSSIVRCDWEIHRHLCDVAPKCQSRSHALRFVPIHDHSLKPSCAKLLMV
jgi:hypothetical protein